MNTQLHHEGLPPFFSSTTFTYSFTHNLFVGARVKSRPIKTVHGNADPLKVKSKVIPKSAVERELIGTL